jgi:hypothetical protein
MMGPTMAMAFNVSLVATAAPLAFAVGAISLAIVALSFAAGVPELRPEFPSTFTGTTTITCCTPLPVTGGMLWANLHLLCWLSLFP